MPEATICASCKQAFMPRRATSKYCSRSCMYVGRPKPQRAPVVRYKNQKGYVEMRVTENGATTLHKEHRFVVEHAIGRRLRPDENVHHVNGVKDDNRLENLQIISHSDHSKLTNSERTYRRGYKLALSDDERRSRSDRFKKLHADGVICPPQFLKKARGE